MAPLRALPSGLPRLPVSGKLSFRFYKVVMGTALITERVHNYAQSHPKAEAAAVPNFRLIF